MAKSKQQKMQEQFSAMFAGMDPIEDQTAEPAAEQPKKKRGRPKKTEPKPEKKIENRVRSAYELTKEAEEKARLEGRIIETEVEIISQEPQTFEVAYTEHTKPEPKPQKKSERKSPFSVWLDQKTAADLKMYGAISGEKTTDIVERALTEYMNRHKLTEDQKTAYKQKMMNDLNDI